MHQIGGFGADARRHTFNLDDKARWTWPRTVVERLSVDAQQGEPHEWTRQHG